MLPDTVSGCPAAWLLCLWVASRHLGTCRWPLFTSYSLPLLLSQGAWGGCFWGGGRQSASRLGPSVGSRGQVACQSNEQLTSKLQQMDLLFPSITVSNMGVITLSHLYGTPFHLSVASQKLPPFFAHSAILPRCEEVTPSSGKKR